MVLKLMILLTSPPPSTCADPGPWQDSQPCPSCRVVLKCGVRSNLFVYRSSWHVLQVSLPTYFADSFCGEATAFCWSSAAKASGVNSSSKTAVLPGAHCFHGFFFFKVELLGCKST